MEIIIAVVVLGIIVWIGYTHVLDKEKADGSHPLDSVKRNSEITETTPMPILTKTGDLVDVQAPSPVDSQITDAVTQTKEKKMATKKPAPAKEPKKPAPAKKPKK